MSGLTGLPAEVTFVYVDSVGSDWVGIYADGHRVYEGHPPEGEDVLDRLGIAYSLRTVPSDSLRVPGVRGLPLTLPRSTS